MDDRVDLIHGAGCAHPAHAAMGPAHGHGIV